MLLMEAVITVVVLSVGLILVLGSFGYSIRAIKSLKDYSQAMLLAEEKMVDLENRGAVGPGNVSGVFGKHDKFSWQEEVVKCPDLELNKVRLSVAWKGGEIFLTTYLRNEKIAQ